VVKEGDYSETSYSEPIKSKFTSESPAESGELYPPTFSSIIVIACGLN
jgi:hypothetical protein